MFTHFGQRLKRDLKQLVDRRLEASAVASGSVQRVRWSFSDTLDSSTNPDWHSSLPALRSMLSRTSANGGFMIIGP